MNRCLLPSLMAAPLLAAAITCAAHTALPTVQTALAAAQPGQRNFPSHAQRGILRIDQMPYVQLNGQTIRTAPGFRLFSADNQLILAHTIHDQSLQVVYVKEANTNWLLTAWILTPEEIQAQPAKR